MIFLQLVKLTEREVVPWPDVNQHRKMRTNINASRGIRSHSPSIQVMKIHDWQRTLQEQQLNTAMKTNSKVSALWQFFWYQNSDYIPTVSSKLHT